MPHIRKADRKMTHKERQLAAIRRKDVDRISRDVIAIENGAKIFGRPDYDYQELLRLMDTDGRVVFTPGYLGETRSGRDEWGAPSINDYGTSHAYPLSFVQEAADLKKYTPPSPDDYDFTSSATLAKRYSAEYAVRGPYWKSLFCVQNGLFGMEDNLANMLLEPGIFEASLNMVFEHTYRYCENYLNAVGDDLDILYLGDDFASQRGLLFDPALWRKYFRDKYRALFELGRKRGKLIWFHSCGDITSVLPDLIDIGVDVWETVQLHTLPISPETLKREYGKDLSFFGGVSTQSLPFKTPEEVRTEAAYCVQALGPTGYILGPDHHIKPDVSAENTLALFHYAGPSQPA